MKKKDNSTDIEKGLESRSELLVEYLKCKNDFNYFCSKYILIEVPGGDINLVPYRRQNELIQEIQEYKNILVLKSRQIGISTIIKAYSTWLNVFFKNVVVGIISKDGREATDFARDVRGMIEKLPLWMRPKFKKQTEQSFILSNGSKTYAAPVNPNKPGNTLRGKAVTFLIIDEAAFINHLDAAWTSLVPALSTSQKHARKNNVPYGTIVLSTPNKTLGQGAWFYNNYVDAVCNFDVKDEHGKEVSAFRPFVIHWKQIPELAEDPDWYSTQCRLFGNDPRKIEQELELKFIPSGGAFFDQEVCTILQNTTMNSSPIERHKVIGGGELWIFEQFVPGKHYLIGVDTATAYGTDRSGIQVVDFETCNQVAEFQGKLKVNEFSKVVEYVANLYSEGTIIVENNSVGNGVVEYLEETDLIARIYKDTRGSKIAPGVSNNTKTRPLIIDALYSMVVDDPYIIKSSRLAMELIGLVEKKGKVQSDDGCHDDLALALAMTSYIRKYDPPLDVEIAKPGRSRDITHIMNLNKPMNVLSRQFSDSDDDTKELEDMSIDEINDLVMSSIKNMELGNTNNVIDVYKLLYTQ